MVYSRVVEAECDLAVENDCGARILNEMNAQDRDLLEALRADPQIEFIDQWRHQVDMRADFGQAST